MAILAGQYSINDLRNAFRGFFGSNEEKDGTQTIEYQNIRVAIKGTAVRIYRRKFDGNWEFVLKLTGSKTE